MTTKIKEYWRLRGEGWRARDALRQAVTIAEFRAAGGVIDFEGSEHAEPTRGSVRLMVRHDPELYDDSYIDTWTDQTERARKKARVDLWVRIEREGVCGLAGEVHTGQDWVEVDSCWSFIGDDWEDSGYDADIMGLTLDARKALLNSPDY